MPKRKKGLWDIPEADLAAISAVARSGVGIAGIMYHDLDDIRQELSLKLVRKAHLFRRRRQKWGTFRKIVLRNCMADIIKHRMHPRQYCCYLGQLSLNANVKTDADSFDDGLSEFIDMVTTDGLLADNTEKPELPGADLKIDVDAFLITLPPELRRVCQTLKKHPVGDAARVLKISRNTLYRRMETIRKGMKTAGFDTLI